MPRSACCPRRRECRQSGRGRPGGNAANAKACQQGGGETLARTGDAGTAFLSEEACVSYGAQGGTLVPYAPVVYNPSLTAVTVGTTRPNHCQAHVTGTCFEPTRYYPYSTWWNGNLTTTGDVMTSDANGNFAFYAWGVSKSHRNLADTFQAQIGDVKSNVISIAVC